MASTNPRRRRGAGTDNPSTAATRPSDAVADAAVWDDDHHAPTSIINSGDCRLVHVHVKVVEYGPDGSEIPRRRHEPLVSVEVEIEVHHGACKPQR